MKQYPDPVGAGLRSVEKTLIRGGRPPCRPVRSRMKLRQAGTPPATNHFLSLHLPLFSPDLEMGYILTNALCTAADCRRLLPRFELSGLCFGFDRRKIFLCHRSDNSKSRIPLLGRP